MVMNMHILLWIYLEKGPLWFAKQKFLLKYPYLYVICSVESHIMHFGLTHFNCLITFIYLREIISSITVCRIFILPLSIKDLFHNNNKKRQEYVLYNKKNNLRILRDTVKTRQRQSRSQLAANILCRNHGRKRLDNELHGCRCKHLCVHISIH